MKYLLLVMVLMAGNVGASDNIDHAQELLAVKAELASLRIEYDELYADHVKGIDYLEQCLSSLTAAQKIIPQLTKKIKVLNIMMGNYP